MYKECVINKNKVTIGKKSQENIISTTNHKNDIARKQFV